MSLISDRAKLLLAQGNVYAQGCSEFVSDVLQIPWEDANSLMGANPAPVGNNGNYNNLLPGNIVGWINPAGHGHVAVYVGEAGTMLIDVSGPGSTPRSLSSYGPQPLFKSLRF